MANPNPAWRRFISEVASATRRKPIDPQDEVNAAIRRERRAAMGARVRHRSPGRGECRSSSGTKCGHGAHGCISSILKCAQATLIRCNNCLRMTRFRSDVSEYSEQTVCRMDAAFEPKGPHFVPDELRHSPRPKDRSIYGVSVSCNPKQSRFRKTRWRTKFRQDTNKNGLQCRPLSSEPKAHSGRQ